MCRFLDLTLVVVCLAASHCIIYSWTLITDDEAEKLIRTTVAVHSRR